MNNFFCAVKSEHRKLWSKSSSLFCIFAVVALSFALSILITALCSAGVKLDAGIMDNTLGENVFRNSYGADWRKDAQDIISTSESRLPQIIAGLNDGVGTQSAVLKREAAKLARDSAIASYRLNNDISTAGDAGWHTSLLVMWLLLPVIAVIAVVYASDMFAGEAERGVIRIILARPVTRKKMYAAKLFTSAVYQTVLIIAAWLGVSMACGLLTGRENAAYVGYYRGEVYTMTWNGFSALFLLCCGATVFCAVSLCAAVGCASRSRTVSAVCAISLVFSGLYLGGAAGLFDIRILGLTIIGSLDLTIPLSGIAWNCGCDVVGCVLSVAAHTFVFLSIGSKGFGKDF